METPTMNMQGTDTAQGQPRNAMAPDSGRLKRFGRDEDGALIVFSLFLFVLMSMLGGLAIDLMHYEKIRTEMSQTLDRCVLSAASLTQSLDPQGVVEDCVDKAGMAEYLSSVTVDEGLNFREVSARASADTQPFFVHMLGIEDLFAHASSTAEQRISNVEVSLVLDISGSMAGSRINNLRPAAREFIDTVLASSDPGRVTISIVPYAGHVNLGEPLESQFNVTENHTASYCIDLPPSTYGSISLSQTTPFTHAGHFDPYYSAMAPTLHFCSPRTVNTVLPLNDNATVLKAKINGLVAEGNTSIDIGMKWGSLLLDPGAQPIIEGLIGRGTVNAGYAGRPLNPAVNDVLKIVVLMTDGENTTEYRLKPGYDSGLSNVWRRNSNGALSLYHEPRSGTTKFFRLSDGKWYTTPDGGTTGATRLTYPELWAQASVSWVAMNIYSRALHGSTTSGQNTWFNTFVSAESADKNNRLQTVCNAAKAAGITVFGIGFEAPSGGRTQVRNCATSTAHYFDAKGLSITTAFRAIASQISLLRLTQ
ncbi:VWA domain-containing protein [Paracoccaceae bacterium Fryx2]|nr:VWA domain-containing protein [Paracoccaceae bacterium Fryx2]